MNSTGNTRRCNSRADTANNKLSSNVTLKPLTSSGNFGSGFLSDVDLGSLRSKINFLEIDLQKRQEAYITRERAYKSRIFELEEDIGRERQVKSGWMKTDDGMAKLKNLHQEILSHVVLVQDRTSRILQEQEKDLLRAFRARLFDVQTELEKEKSKKDDGDSRAWIKKSRDLEERVEAYKEIADKLERTNQTLNQENQRLQTQFQNQEDDRDYIVKQLEHARKDNSDWRARFERLDKEVSLLEEKEKNLGLEKGTNARVSVAKSDADERYKEVNKKLQKLLESERGSLDLVRRNYQQELDSRTETELLLRQCIDDVRRELLRRQKRSREGGSSGSVPSTPDKGALDPASLVTQLPIDKFSAADRERVLELLLSQERVVALLYSKALQANKSAAAAADDEVLAPTGSVLAPPAISRKGSSPETTF